MKKITIRAKKVAQENQILNELEALLEPRFVADENSAVLQYLEEAKSDGINFTAHNGDKSIQIFLPKNIVDELLTLYNDNFLDLNEILTAPVDLSSITNSRIPKIPC